MSSPYKRQPLFVDSQALPSIGIHTGPGVLVGLPVGDADGLEVGPPVGAAVAPTTALKT